MPVDEVTVSVDGGTSKSVFMVKSAFGVRKQRRFLPTSHCFDQTSRVGKRDQTEHNRVGVLSLRTSADEGSRLVGQPGQNIVPLTLGEPRGTPVGEQRTTQWRRDYVEKGVNINAVPGMSGSSWVKKDSAIRNGLAKKCCPLVVRASP